MSWRHRTARRVALVSLACGVVALGFASYDIIGARMYQSAERQRFEETTPSAVAVPVPTDGTSIGEIQIPRLGLRAMIAQGESTPILRRSVGHLADTALPGEVGTSSWRGIVTRSFAR
jgi:sortase (surface protein transpeptidase)